MRQEPSEAFISDIIGAAWADDVSFDQIKQETGLSESDVIALMRRHLKATSFKLWRRRVYGRRSKHEKRARCLEQEIDTASAPRKRGSTSH